MRYIHHLRAKSYHINRFGDVSTSFLFWYMQEIAWEHAKVMGFGFDDLREDELFWVLSRFYVRIDRRPRWTEEFTLETWSRGTDGFFAYRDFRFLGSGGEEIIRATSSWLVLNLHSRRIVRLSQMKSFPGYSESLLGFNPGKVEAPLTVDEPEFFPVLFNEIDINQHFNTGRYLERINNSYSFDFLRTHMLREMEVNFLKEGLPDDRLTVRQQRVTPLEHLCSIQREKDLAELISARLVWEQRV